MKKMFALVLCLSLALSLTACGGEEPEDTPAPPSKEVTVFAAASLEESLTEIAELYKAVDPDVSLIFSFDSSGTLKKQIAEGATCDLFIAASQKPMNQLDAAMDAEKNPDGLDFINSDTRKNLLENKVTLVVPEGNPKGVTSFDQLAQLLQSGEVLLGMGNSDVPVGQYTLKIFDYYGLHEEDLAAAGALTYGSNVKEVTTQVAEAAVDCGVIYATDAFSAGLEVVDTATVERCGQAIYPAAVLKDAPQAEAAQAFLEYLATEPCAEIFENIGFSMVE